MGLVTGEFLFSMYSIKGKHITKYILILISYFWIDENFPLQIFIRFLWNKMLLWKDHFSPVDLQENIKATGIFIHYILYNADFFTSSLNTSIVGAISKLHLIV